MSIGIITKYFRLQFWEPQITLLLVGQQKEKYYRKQTKMIIKSLQRYDSANAKVVRGLSLTRSQGGWGRGKAAPCEKLRLSLDDQNGHCIHVT